MKKKKILLGVLLATAAFGMAACTNTSKTDDDADKQTQTDETKYTITFDSKGGSAVGSIEVQKDSKATAPTAPTKAADANNTYTFAGWYKDSACTQAFDFANETITGDITLYAKWTATPIVKYSVTFELNGGTGSITSQQIVAGGKATRPTTDPTKAADADNTYAFAGWFKDAALSTEFNFTTETINSATTIYAKWTATPITKYSVTFELNGGTGSIASQQVVAGGKATRPTTDPTKADDAENTYEFAGWFKDAGLTTEFDFATETINSATTIYAKWTATPIPATKYTVTFNLNGGTGSIASQQVEEGGKVTRPTTDPTKAADAENTYDFAGWYKDAGLTTKFDFATETITQATTIYAKWIATPILEDNYIDFSIEYNNVNRVLEVGNTIDLTGLKVSGLDLSFNSVDLAASEYYVKVINPNGEVCDITDPVIAGTYTIEIHVGTLDAKSFTINVKAAQYKFSIPLTADDYNESRGTDKITTGDMTFSAETKIYEAKSLDITANTGVKLQVTDSNGNPVSKDYDGVTYNSRLQVNTGTKSLKITAKASGSITVLFATDATRTIDCTDGSSSWSSEAPTAENKESMHVFTIEAVAGKTYTFTSSTGGSNIYAIIFNGSVDATTRVATDDLFIDYTETEFNNTTNKFNASNPNTLTVISQDNYGINTPVALSDCEIVVKNSAQETVTGELEVADTYTVSVSYGGKTESYTISVIDLNTPISAISVNTTDATTKFYENGDAFTAEGIVVTATRGSVESTLQTDEYTILVDSFTTAGTYVVTITSVENPSVSTSYNVAYNTIDSIVINAPATLNVKTGTTVYNNHATAEGTYTDDTKVALDITTALYSDSACTTEIADASTAFATAGATVYAKLTCRGTTKITTITVKDFTANAYDFENTDVTTEDIAAGTTVINKTDVTVKNVGIKANVIADKSTATANDNSGKTFTKALVTTGGMSDTKYYEITTTTNAIVTIYFTATDGKFGTTDQTKGGELVVNDEQVDTVKGNKDNKIAYAYTFETDANTPVKIRISSNRLALFGIVVES